DLCGVRIKRKALHQENVIAIQRKRHRRKPPRVKREAEGTKMPDGRAIAHSEQGGDPGMQHFFVGPGRSRITQLQQFLRREDRRLRGHRGPHENGDGEVQQLASRDRHVTVSKRIANCSYWLLFLRTTVFSSMTT